MNRVSRREFVRIGAACLAAPNCLLGKQEEQPAQDSTGGKSHIDSIIKEYNVPPASDIYDINYKEISGGLALEKGLEVLGGQEIKPDDTVTLLYYTLHLNEDDMCQGIHIFVNGNEREFLESNDTNVDDIEIRIERNDRYYVVYGWDIDKEGNRKAMIKYKKSNDGLMDFTGINAEQKIAEGQKFYNIARKLERGINP